MFLILMVVGLVGLLVMALPAFARHGAAGHGAAGRLGHAGHAALHAGHAALHVGHVAKLAAKAGAAPAHGLVKHAPGHAATETAAGVTRFLPSPRLVFSLLALYGAFGNALVRAVHLRPLWAALVAVLPALAVERFLVTPLWNLLFRFQGQPSSPLEELVLSEARAVTPFRNGRGIVALVRDGRTVQFSARLAEPQAGREVRVGDRLRVEDVDAQRERLTVSLAEE